MDTNVRAELFSQLKKVLDDIGAQTAVVKGADFQNGDTLRLLTPVDEQGGTALIEFSLIDVDEEVSIMQLYTTVLAAIPAGPAELEKAFARMNLTCPIGAYGVFYSSSQCFHKYSAIVEADTSVDDAVNYIMRSLQFIIQVIAMDYPLIVALGTGDTTFDKAVADGHIKL